MSPPGRLIIICGLPGAGKTTLAKRLETRLRAVRLAPDEWMQALSINLHEEAARARIETLQWSLARRLLACGQTAIIEWGTWARSERDALRLGARALGAAVELHGVAAPPDVLFARIRSRAMEDPPISRDTLDRWVEIYQAPDEEELALYDPPADPPLTANRRSGSALEASSTDRNARLATLHRFYARAVTTKAGVSDARIVDAFASVRREDFLGPGPWQIKLSADGYMDSGTDDPAVVYQDLVIGLLPDRQLNNGEPSLHAGAMAAASPQPGNVVIHVGAGTGYYTAILARLVSPSGRVHAYEIDPDLARRAAENLAGDDHVSVRAESAISGSLPRADVIYASAGATHVPIPWLDALTAGGRLVLPLTPDGRGGLGCMLAVTRQADEAYEARVLFPAAFIPCVGARDADESRALAAALDTRPPEAVRSLRRDTPDDSAWCIGKGWWLSTRKAGEDG